MRSSEPRFTISKATRRIEKRGYNFTLNATSDDVREEGYDALVVPGGRSPEYLRFNARVLETVRLFDRAKKPIAAVCHGVHHNLTVITSFIGDLLKC